MSTQAPDSEDILGRAYDARLMRRLWTYVHPYRFQLALAAGLLFLATLAQLAQPYLLRLAIDLFIVPLPDPGGWVESAQKGLARLKLGRQGGLLVLTLVFLLVIAVEQVLRFGQLYLMQRVGQQAMRDLRNALHAHVQRLAMSFFDRTPIGRIMTRLTSDVESLAELFAGGIVAILGDLVFLLGLVVVLLTLNVRLALITFSALPVLLGAVALFRHFARRAFREIRVRIARINAFLQEHITGMKVVQLFAREERTLADFESKNAAHLRANSDAIRYDAMLFAFVELVSFLVVAALVFYGGRRLLGDAALAAAGRQTGAAVTFGVLVAFIDYTRKFFIPVRDLSDRFTVMQQAMASAERVFTLLDTDEWDAPATSEAPREVSREVSRAAPSSTVAPEPPHIELRGVEFQYRRRPQDGRTLLAIDEVPQNAAAGGAAAGGEGGAIRGVDLAVRRGEQLAVVGATGAGKTTLAKLLVRLYEPEGGALLLAGEDVRRLPLAELRRRIVIVPQDVHLFSGDLLGNITLGDERISEEAVAEAARRIGLDRLLERLPDGLHSRVEERGGNLSAGERQLIAFARALVREPEVLILDEATANLDPEAERRIQAATDLLLKDRTAIIIAHRLSTLERSSRIVVMHHGRIAEQGTHAELLAKDGIYARLKRLQQAA